ARRQFAEREFKGDVLEPFLVESLKELEQLKSERKSLGDLIRRSPIWSEERLERLREKQEPALLRDLIEVDEPWTERKKGKRHYELGVEDLLFGQVRPNLLYERPMFTGDQRVFSDLVSY